MTLKIFGMFKEIDGEEFETMEDLVKSKGLIGSQSADVGTVELYYDEAGNIYAVAHDSEEYYGKKSDEDADTLKDSDDVKYGLNLMNL